MSRLNVFEQWALERVLQRVADGADASKVVEELHAKGRHRIANALARATDAEDPMLGSGEPKDRPGGEVG